MIPQSWRTLRGIKSFRQKELWIQYYLCEIYYISLLAKYKVRGLSTAWMAPARMKRWILYIVNFSFLKILQKCEQYFFSGCAPGDEIFGWCLQKTKLPGTVNGKTMAIFCRSYVALKYFFHATESSNDTQNSLKQVINDDWTYFLRNEWKLLRTNLFHRASRFESRSTNQSLSNSRNAVLGNNYY